MSFRQQRPPRSADEYELGLMMYEEAQSQSPCAVVETEFVLFLIYIISRLLSTNLSCADHERHTFSTSVVASSGSL